MASPGDLETKVSEIERFAQEYGEKGIKQLERVTRQMERTEQVLNILETDQGFDPYRGADVRVLQTEVAVETYDDLLAAAIDKSVDRPVLQCIGGCLWLYVDRDPAKSREERTAAFSAALFEQSPAIRRWNEERHGVATLVDVMPLDANLFEPEAMPLVLRPLRPEVIRDVLLGGLKERVLLYFDWIEYGHLIEGLGAKLSWSSPKVGRVEASRPYPERRAIVGGRVPRVQLPNGRFVDGQSKVYRVLSEGVLPSVIARQYVELLHLDLPSGEEK